MGPPSVQRTPLPLGSEGTLVEAAQLASCRPSSGGGWDSRMERCVTWRKLKQTFDRSCLHCRAFTPIRRDYGRSVAMAVT